MKLWSGHPGLGPNLTAEKQRSMPSGSPVQQSVSPGPACLSLILNLTGRKIDKYSFSSSEPPLLCMCIQKKKNVAKISYLSMGRCPEQPPWKQTNPVISGVLGSALVVYRSLVLSKIVALVQGPGATSSGTLAFPACFGFHTMAWGDVEMSTCLEVSASDLNMTKNFN